VDEVEDVEGHGADTIDFRIGKLECVGKMVPTLCCT
jgi:hypothetical protein